MKVFNANPIERDENLVLIDGGQFYRFIPDAPVDQKRWGSRVLMDFLESPTHKKLLEQKLVLDYQLTDLNPADYELPAGKIFKTDNIPFFSYPWEWTNRQILDVVLAIIKINQELDPAIVLGDVQFLNFSFIGSNPVLVDLGAISNRMYETDYRLMRQYIFDRLQKYQFFSDNPQAVSLCAPVEPNISKAEFISGYRALSGFAPAEAWNQWNGYENFLPADVNHLVGDGEVQRVSQWAIKLPVKTVLDAAGFTGRFVWEVAKAGKPCAVADICSWALTRGYNISKAYGLPVSYLKLDITEPSVPEQRVVEWHNRLRADCCICSSITHHLFCKGLCFKTQANLFGKLARKYIMAEYIDKTDDSAVKTWNLPAHYNRQAFVESFVGWKIIDNFANSQTRHWFLFERLPGGDTA